MCVSRESEEFRDAIESLSPEQQKFAKAIRSMQLESTLFLRDTWESFLNVNF